MTPKQRLAKKKELETQKNIEFATNAARNAKGNYQKASEMKYNQHLDYKALASNEHRKGGQLHEQELACPSTQTEIGLRQPSKDYEQLMR